MDHGPQKLMPQYNCYFFKVPHDTVWLYTWAWIKTRDQGRRAAQRLQRLESLLKAKAERALKESCINLS